jgi:hypothetical protein
MTARRSPMGSAPSAGLDPAILAVIEALARRQAALDYAVASTKAGTAMPAHRIDSRPALSR